MRRDISDHRTSARQSSRPRRRRRMHESPRPPRGRRASAASDDVRPRRGPCGCGRVCRRRRGDRLAGAAPRALNTMRRSPPGRARCPTSVSSSSGSGSGAGSSAAGRTAVVLRRGAPSSAISKQHDGDVVLAAAVVRARDQLPRGARRGRGGAPRAPRGSRRRRPSLVSPSEQSRNTSPGCDLDRERVDVDVRVGAERARDHRALRMRLGLLRARACRCGPARRRASGRP